MALSCSECGPPITVTFIPELYFFLGTGACGCGARAGCIFLFCCTVIGFCAARSVDGATDDGEVDVEEAFDDEDETDEDVEDF